MVGLVAEYMNHEVFISDNISPDADEMIRSCNLVSAVQGVFQGVEMVGSYEYPSNWCCWVGNRWSCMTGVEA